MSHNGVLGTQQFLDKPIVDRTHPAIIRGGAFRQDGRVLPRGRVVAKDSNGEYAAYEPGLADADARADSTAYVAGDLVTPATANGHYYRCVTGGTSHSAAPTWPTATGATVADGTVVWEEAGLIGVDDLAGGGVLTEAIDTSVESIGPVLKHGTVVGENLDVAGEAASAAAIAALEAISIFAV
jgi:hypothetical protein